MTMATVAVFHWCFADASGNSMTCLSVRVRACEETNASSDSAAWKMYRVVLASLSRCPFSGQNVALFCRTGRAVRAGRANRTRQLHKEGRYSVTVDWTVRRTKCGWTWYIRGNSSDPKLTGLREECSGTEGQANKYVQKVAFATTFTPCELPSRHRKMQRESQSPRRGKKKGKLKGQR
ncbi:uncharacterized protein LOC111265383 isoform X1 [Varroa jacobsoni]|uniref:uncharacterized protein LOC111265383 isoform X1 n=1 Tax=Varroa jacobsoni TaxID=62625 RepID=UPI000BF2DB6B|nr:uncharacterized protein LOC111265383 isoform X1 [Varroa jacobsoni]